MAYEQIVVVEKFKGNSQVSSYSITGGGASVISGTGGASSLAGLSDVSLLSVMSNEDVLTYDEDSGKWINAQGAGGVTKTYVDGSLYLRDVSIDWLNVNKVNVFGDDMTGNLRMIENARIQTDFIDSSTAYFSGFAGSGMRISNEDGDFSAVFDNLTVRKMMKVYELQIAKISAVNGGLIISSANGKALDVSQNDTRIIFDENGVHNLITFAVDDYLRAQEYLSDGVKYYLGQCTSIHHDPCVGHAYIDVTNITGTPWAGADLVQVGNSTDTTRQNLIYITASDDNNPYIDILAGVDTNGSFTGKTKVRTGNLKGITDTDFSPYPLTGYGLYATGDVYVKGNIQLANSVAAAPIATDPKFSNLEAGSGKPEDNATVGATWGSNINNEPTSLGDINSTEGNKLTGIEVGATVGATWGTNLNSIPTTLTAPTGSGLFLSGDHMGFYNSGWKTYIDNSGNMLLGDISGTNPGLVWNNNTATLSIKGAINITSGSVPWGTVDGATKPEDNATRGATWGSNINSQPTFIGAPSGSGLFMDASYFGYYSGGTWQSYVDWTGKAKFVDAIEFGTSTESDNTAYQNLAIKGNSIWENTVASDLGRININMKGHNGGTSQYRNTVIGNGRGYPVLTVSGPSSSVIIEGNLTFQPGSHVYSGDRTYMKFGEFTTLERAALSKERGMMVYDTDKERFYGVIYYSGALEWWAFGMVDRNT